jgi:hypothetical protein
VAVAGEMVHPYCIQNQQEDVRFVHRKIENNYHYKTLAVGQSPPTDVLDEILS